MLLLQDGHGGVVGVHPRLRDRVANRVRIDRLDLDLAHGANPDACVELALRAEELTRTETRRWLAESLRRVLVSATSDAPAAGLPVNRTRVLTAAEPIAELRRRLLAPGPVSVRGVAQVQVLLSTGWGPLSNRGDADCLTHVVRQALEALDPIPA